MTDQVIGADPLPTVGLQQIADHPLQADHHHLIEGLHQADRLTTDHHLKMGKGARVRTEDTATEIDAFLGMAEPVPSKDLTPEEEKERVHTGLTGEIQLLTLEKAERKEEGPDRGGIILKGLHTLDRHQGAVNPGAQRGFKRSSTWQPTPMHHQKVKKDTSPQTVMSTISVKKTTKARSIKLWSFPYIYMFIYNEKFA